MMEALIPIAIQALYPVIASLASWGIYELTRYIRSKTQNEQAVAALEQIGLIVETNVADLAQTIADDMRKTSAGGKLTKEDAAKLRDLALRRINEQVPATVSAAAGTLVSNLDAYIRARMEQAVRYSKPLILVLLVPLIASCSAVQVAEQHPALTEIAVRAAVGRVLDAHPDWVKPTVEIMDSAMAALEGDNSTTLAGLEAHIVGKIDWQGLKPEEEDLLKVLIRAIREEIEAYLASQGVKVPEDVAVKVRAVLCWIRESAMIRAARG